MVNFISNKLKIIFLNDKILNIIKYYNIIILIIYVIGSFAYLFDINFYKNIHMILVSLLGFNLFSLVSIGYIMAKFNFCMWSKMAYISNIIICIIYLIIQLLKSLFYLFELTIDINWSGIIMTIISSILLIFTLKYIIWNKS